jgi:hypothetical protein
MERGLPCLDLRGNGSFSLPCGTGILPEQCRGISAVGPPVRGRETPPKQKTFPLAQPCALDYSSPAYLTLSSREELPCVPCI